MTARRIQRVAGLIRMDGGSEADGLVHIEGSGVCGLETMCGYVDTFSAYESVPRSTPVECPGCWDAYTLIRGAGRLNGPPTR